MLHERKNPIGIDAPISGLQKLLYRKLKVLWNADDQNLEGYSRVYRNKNDKGYVPELFVNSPESGNSEYKALYFDKDNLKGLFFFDAADRETYRQEEGTATVNLSVIFMVNLAKIRPSHTRADEEIRNELRVILSVGYYETRLTGSEVGFQNVFKSFTGMVNKDGEVFEDRHPFFCFKMNLELAYQPAEIKC